MRYLAVDPSRFSLKTKPECSILLYIPYALDVTTECKEEWNFRRQTHDEVVVVVVVSDGNVFFGLQQRMKEGGLGIRCTSLSLKIEL